jgi:hypothetical protein
LAVVDHHQVAETSARGLQRQGKHFGATYDLVLSLAEFSAERSELLDADLRVLKEVLRSYKPT